MTVAERILAKPGPVIDVIRAYMTKASLRDEHPNWEAYGAKALEWWEETFAFCCSGIAPAPEIFTEEMIAVLILERLRKQEVFGRILRALEQ